MKGILVCFCLILAVSGMLGDGNAQVVLETSLLEEGIIGVHYINNTANRIKVMIKKDDSRHIYNMINEKENFPLQMGNGSYIVKLLENIGGNRFKEIFKDTLEVKMTEENSVFLGSVQMVKWEPAMKPIKKAKALVNGAGSDEERVKRIHAYLVYNMDYDYGKINSLTATYIPDIEQIYMDKKGICFDHASLFAAMLRSVGIPAKLVKGYGPIAGEYHAWNEVFLESQNTWITVDITRDIGYNKANIPFTMIKDAGDYYKDKEF
jgi:transglutaminase/protease-like cytokinesis protein 3